MILSVSRRTDIPSYYGKWFIKRLNEGFVYVRNPLNYHQVSNICLSPGVVDCIVFWTKNPSDEFIDDLNLICKMGYKFYFQYTITSYNSSIEKNIPFKKNQIERFQRISEMIGKDKIIWRYDPIFVNRKYDVHYHKKWFGYLADSLSQYTEKCVISFLDFYPRIKNRLSLNDINEISISQIGGISEKLSIISKEHNIKIETCCENIDLLKFGITHGHCIDSELISHICNKNFDIKKDKTQRMACGCVESIDIGTYNTCRNGCIYCYATWQENLNLHYDIDSPLLCSQVSQEDIITERKIFQCKTKETNLFDC